MTNKFWDQAKRDQDNVSKHNALLARKVQQALPPSSLKELIHELTEALRATVGPEFEGFEDLERLNINPESKAQVNFDINAAKRRRDRVKTALDALMALQDDGYPDVPMIDVSPTVYDDLFAQGVSIEAALRRYRRLPDPAVGGMVTIE